MRQSLAPTYPASNRYKEYKVVVVVGKRVFGGKVGFVQLELKNPCGEHAFLSVENPYTYPHLSTIYPHLCHPKTAVFGRKVNKPKNNGDSFGFYT